MMLALQIINAVFLTVIILCAIDASRATQPAAGFWRAVANMTLAVGAAGCLLWYRPTTLEAAFFATLQNAGLVVLSGVYLRRELRKVSEPLPLQGAWRHVVNR